MDVCFDAAREMRVDGKGWEIIPCNGPLTHHS